MAAKYQLYMRKLSLVGVLYEGLPESPKSTLSNKVSIPTTSEATIVFKYDKLFFSVDGFLGHKWYLRL